MSEEPTGHDTPTGTNPDAKYDEPGYEDKSIGQAGNEDQELVDELVDETGSKRQAEQRFEEESSGAPARERQGEPETG